MRRRFLMLLGILARSRVCRLAVAARFGPSNLAVRWRESILLVASFIAVPLGFYARSMHSREWADRLAAVSLFIMGFFSSLFVFTLLRDIALLFAVFFVTAAKLPAVLRLSAEELVLAIAAPATLVGLFNARRRARIVNVEISAAEPAQGVGRVRHHRSDHRHSCRPDDQAGICRCRSSTRSMGSKPT